MRMTLPACALVTIVSALVVARAQSLPTAEGRTAPQETESKIIITLNPARSVTTPSGLVYEIVAEGTGPAAIPGQHVRVHETTKLADGTLIYSTRTKGRPLKFLLGGKQVIAGVDEAVTGMKVGERRKLIVPPKLSKRTDYSAGLSPDAMLYYDIELVEIVKE